MRAPAIIVLCFAAANLMTSVFGVDFRGAVTNRAPLKQRAFFVLPLGTIEPRGWLKTQLERQRDGLTGDLDKHYANVVGPRNGWLGGDGDGWERGPYWIDGLVPLGYILKDDALIAKAKPWIEWTLANQESSGYLGPKRFEAPPRQEPGIQKTPREDWWPRMVMLKVLQQHYSATGDKRVIDVLLKYFRYQAEQLPNTPLDHWSFWGNRRGGDNLMVVYWLYNITGESFLLELGDLIHKQTFPWAQVFHNREPAPSPDLKHLYPYNTDNRYPFKQDLIDRLSVSQLQAFHCVNLAQGIKEPLVFFQRQPDPKLHESVKKALVDIKRFHGQPQGMYGGDEPMHGNAPTRGVELCSVVEMMFSLETMLGITGDLDFADHLEWIAYNALPAQTTEDYRSRQYFQCANQVLITRARRNFYEEEYHRGTDLCFGLLTGYPCCTCNMHQGWPKFVQNLWLGTPDGGLAAMIYGPSAVSTRLPDGSSVRIVEETHFPFEEAVTIRVELQNEAKFPLHFRVPAWAEGKARVEVNGTAIPVGPEQRRSIRLDRVWKNNDVVTLQFPARIRISRWAENSVAVERGPMLYALRVEEEWKHVTASDSYGDYFEVRPLSPWNYGILETEVAKPENAFEFVRRERPQGYPWTLTNSCLELRVSGKRIPEWQLYSNMPGPLPHSRPWTTVESQDPQKLTLIPYGCTKLRITEFPVVK